MAAWLSGMVDFRHISRNRALALAVCALTAIAFAVMFMAMPHCIDDYWYMQYITLHKLQGGEGFPWAAMFDTVRWHYYFDNFRFGNILFTAMIALPHALVAGMTSLIVLASLVLMAGLARCRGSVAGMIWLCFLFTVMMPWREFMVSLCYQFNYLWPSLLALLALRLFFGRKHPSPLATLVLGFFIGWWHEGIGVPLVVMLCFSMLWRPGRYFTPGRIALLAGIFAGTALIMSAPPFFDRVNHRESLFEVALWVRCLRLEPLTFCFWLVYAAMFLRRRTRRAAMSAFLAASFVCTAVALGIHLSTHSGARAGWMGQLLAAICIVRCMPLLCCRSGRRVRLAARCATSAAALFLAAHLVVADAMTFRVRDEINAGLEAWRRSPDGVFFIDYTDETEAPALALEKPTYRFFTDDWCLRRYPFFWGDERRFLPLPAELASASPTAGTAVPGHKGLRRIKSTFFISADDFESSRPRDIVRGAVSFGWLDTPRFRGILVRRFTSPADGRDYYFLIIDEPVPYAWLGGIRAIDWEVYPEGAPRANTRIDRYWEQTLPAE